MTVRLRAGYHEPGGVWKHLGGVDTASVGRSRPVWQGETEGSTTHNTTLDKIHLYSLASVLAGLRVYAGFRTSVVLSG